MKETREFGQYIFLSVALALIGIMAAYILNNRSVNIPEGAIREPAGHTISEPCSEEIIVREDETPGQDKPSEPPLPVVEPPTSLPVSERIVQLRMEYDNPDIVGFVEIPGTSISYPVAQTGNNVFYLYHDLHWSPSSAGSIFLDYENDLYALSDDSTIIYGHNMRAGNKFHNLRLFHDELFFRDNSTILLNTPHQETVWDVFSFFGTTTDFCYLTTNFTTREQYIEFLAELERRSLFIIDIQLTKHCQILVLSTCARIGGNNRYVLVARLRTETERSQSRGATEHS